MKCADEYCEEQFDPEVDDCRYSELLKGWYCWGCYESHQDHSSTVFVVENGEKRAYIVNDFEIVDREYGESVYPGDVIGKGIKRVYRSTDGWRGHYETTIEDWVEVVSGWTTGNWGDSISNSKQVFNEWAQNLLEDSLEEPPPVHVAVIVDPTSNLFSTAVGVFVHRDNYAEFVVWLNGDRETLEYSLT